MQQWFLYGIALVVAVLVAVAVILAATPRATPLQREAPDAAVPCYHKVPAGRERGRARIGEATLDVQLYTPDGGRVTVNGTPLEWDRQELIMCGQAAVESPEGSLWLACQARDGSGTRWTWQQGQKLVHEDVRTTPPGAHVLLQDVR